MIANQAIKLELKIHFKLFKIALNKSFQRNSRNFNHESLEVNFN
jgi:hypothetical protein